MRQNQISIVAFALLMESNEGVLGKSPSFAEEFFILLSRQEDVAGLKLIMGRDLFYKLDNYIEVWSAKEVDEQFDEIEEGEPAQGEQEPQGIDPQIPPPGKGEAEADEILALEPAPAPATPKPAKPKTSKKKG